MPGDEMCHKAQRECHYLPLSPHLARPHQSVARGRSTPQIHIIPVITHRHSACDYFTLTHDADQRPARACLLHKMSR
ncbi:hypothetical protein E2C01_039794 [Portunus trituberculatus]|uniref:Uncharacterized protein n=1 Tax=Portunus trituberculatus TaxID=210409 RepID=A0A5B7FKY3_PORTR|nr:hypothetical protein [Portunus trituberculatus]